MAIAVGSVSNTPTYGTRVNTTITAPSGITNGNLLVAILAVDDTSSLPALTVTPPAGFTEVTNSPSAAAKADPYTISAHVFYKVASGESGDYTFTHTSAQTEGFMYRLTGANTTTPIDATPVVNAYPTTASEITTYNSITTVTNGAFIIAFDSLWDASGSGAISGSTPTLSVRRQGTVAYVADGTLATAGATGSRTRTNGNSPASSNPWCSIVVAIRPAGAAAYSLTAVAGAYTLTGVTTPTRHAWKPQAAIGAYALTGADSTMRRTWKPQAAASSYALTGAAAATLHGRTPLQAAVGAYTLSGSNATFMSTLRLLATSASYALTGSPASPNILVHKTIPAAAGAYTLAGEAVTPYKAVLGAPSTLPVFRSLSSTVYTGDLTGTDCALPTGVVDGDILIASFYAGKPGGSLAIADQIGIAPIDAGWTQVGSVLKMYDGGSGVATFWCWWKRASSEGPTVSFSHTALAGGASNAFTTQVAIAAYSGCIPTGNPVDASSGNTSVGTTATALSITTTVTNTKLVYTGNNWDAPGTLAPPTGMTERFEYAVYVADQDRAAIGSTGNRTQSIPTGNPWTAVLLALKGSGGAGGGISTYTLGAVAGVYTLTGSPVTLIEASGGRQLVAESGSYSLTGTTVTTGRGLLVYGGSYTLTGRPALLLGGTHYGVIAQPGSYSLEGSPVTLIGGVPGQVSGMNVWTGSAWVDKSVKVWTGSTWLDKPVKIWNGSAWL